MITYSKTTNICVVAEHAPWIDFKETERELPLGRCDGFEPSSGVFQTLHFTDVFAECVPWKEGAAARGSVEERGNVGYEPHEAAGLRQRDARLVCVFSQNNTCLMLKRSRRAKSKTGAIS